MPEGYAIAGSGIGSLDAASSAESGAGRLRRNREISAAEIQTTSGRTRTSHSSACMPDVAATPDPRVTPRTVALILQFSKSEDAGAGDTGITINYVSGAGHYSIPVQWVISLCAGDSWHTCRGSQVGHSPA